MVRYQNKEIISYQIENLKELEINNILVVTGYLSNKLISHIKKDSPIFNLLKMKDSLIPIALFHFH